MSRTNPKVNFYFSKTKQWQQELEKLRINRYRLPADRRIEVG